MSRTNSRVRSWRQRLSPQWAQRSSSAAIRPEPVRNSAMGFSQMTRPSGFSAISLLKKVLGELVGRSSGGDIRPAGGWIALPVGVARSKQTEKPS